MTVIFNAKTTDAYHIKILIELLTNNIKVAHLEIDQNGIRLCMMDSHRKILIDFNLNAENFTLYKYKGPKMYLGVNLSHLHRLCKSIKKKDSIQMFIDDENPTKLAIRVIPKENNRLTTSFITIQTVQEIAIEKPSGYKKPVIVSSSEFSKMLKDLGSIGVKTNVTAKNFHIKFNCETGGILERTIEFGEIEDDDSDDTAEEYKQEFVTEQLSRITKIAGLSTQIKIFTGKPLLFRSNIGNLGEISIYIKSKEQLEDESHTILEDGYDSED
jgi:proliferating cell nuclear antigen PCNA